MTDHKFENTRSIFKRFIKDIICKKCPKNAYDEIYQISDLPGSQKMFKKHMELILKYTEKYFKHEYLNSNVLDNLNTNVFVDIYNHWLKIGDLINKIFFPIIDEYNYYVKNIENKSVRFMDENIHTHYFYYYFKDILKRYRNRILDCIVGSLRNRRDDKCESIKLTQLFDALFFYKETNFYHKNIVEFMVDLYCKEWMEKYKVSNIKEFYIELNDFLKREEEYPFFKDIFLNIKQIFLKRILEDKNFFDVLEVFDERKVFKILIDMYEIAELQDRFLQIFSDYIHFILENYLSVVPNNEFYFHLNFIKTAFENLVETSLYSKFTIKYMEKSMETIFEKYEDEITKILNLDFNKQILQGIKEEVYPDFYSKNTKYIHENKRDLIQYKDISISITDFGYYFSKVKDQQRFSDTYKNNLCNRLLSRKTNILSEKNILQNLKKYVSIFYIHKLEMMIKDMEGSTKIDNDEIILVNPHRWPKLIKTNFVCSDKRLKALQCLFKRQKSNKTISFKYDWYYPASTCEVEINGNLIVMTFIQYEIIKLVLKNKYKKDQIIENLKLEEHQEHINILIESNLLIKINEYLGFNRDLKNYPNNICPFVFPIEGEIIKQDEIKENKEAWHNASIDSKIMQKMKQERKIKQETLYKFLKTHFKKIKDEIITNRIDYLKKCEFIETKDDFLLYLP